MNVASDNVQHYSNTALSKFKLARNCGEICCLCSCVIGYFSVIGNYLSGIEFGNQCRYTICPLHLTRMRHNRGLLTLHPRGSILTVGDSNDYLLITRVLP